MKRTDYTPEIIRKKVRQRLVWKIIALIVLEIAGIVFMRLYGEWYFGRLSEVNVYVAYAVLAVAPILLCGILYDIVDRDWTGEIRKIRTSVVRKWSGDDTGDFNSNNLSVGRNNRYSVSVNIRMKNGEAADKNLGIILDSDLDRMREGDTLTHFRGTRLYHTVSCDRSHPDHFIGRL
ncbi:MAG: hypothetical protein E7662_06315 [Ruminococcaceae bacterium]|nr:hypothetical protein [Oscillospiraceae bacterium]